MQLYFDASDADLSVSSEDINGFSVNGSQVQLSTTGGYFIDSQGLSGDRQDVLTYQATSLGDNTTGSYAGITFDGSLIFGRPPGETIDLNALDYFNFPQTKNHPPTAQDLTGEVAEDGSVSIQLLGDDGEPDIDQPLTYVIVRGPDHGSITGFDPATGLVTYHPFSNYNGTDQITYLVQETDPNGVVFVSELAVVDITITPVNDAPFVRLGHSQFTGDQNVPLLITGISVGDVEANAAQSPVSVVLSADTGTLTLPTNSTVQISGNGTARITLVGTTSAINQLLSQGVTFQPDADFSGSANLNVTIADSLDPSTALQASATVGIDILSADQQVSGFRQQLIRLVQDGDLSWRIGQKLLAAFHGRLNTHHIRQTIQQIAKLAHKGRIDTGVAQQLIDHLKAINESITTRHAHSFHHALDRFFAKLSHAHRHGHSR